MHYKNGRKAEIGDLVIGMTYNKPSVQVGKVVTLTADAKTCNVIIRLPSETPWHSFEQEYSQCDWLLHIDDVWAFVIGVAFTPQHENDYFAKVHNFAMKWNAPMPETRGINAAPRD